MTTNELTALVDHLNNKNGKETNAVKMRMVYEHLNIYQTINNVSQQLLSAAEHFKELVNNDIEENWTDSDGKVMATQLATLVSSVIYAKNNNNIAPADATMKFVLDHTFSVIWML